MSIRSTDQEVDRKSHSEGHDYEPRRPFDDVCSPEYKVRKVQEEVPCTEDKLYDGSLHSLIAQFLSSPGAIRVKSKIIVIELLIQL